MDLKNNVGMLDKLIRIPIGLLLIAGGFYFNSFWGLVGIIPLVSGISGFCPLYSIFSISTAKTTKVK